MANAVRISDLNITTSVGANDRIIVLTNPNTAIANVQTILATSLVANSLSIQSRPSTPYTLQLTDAFTQLYCHSNGNITIPQNANVGFSIGTTIKIMTDSNTIIGIIAANNTATRVLLANTNYDSNGYKMANNSYGELIQTEIDVWQLHGTGMTGA